MNPLCANQLLCSVVSPAKRDAEAAAAGPEPLNIDNYLSEELSDKRRKKSQWPRETAHKNIVRFENSQ